MSTVLGWRVRKVGDGLNSERFLVHFLEADSEAIVADIWAGDGVERSLGEARDYAASFGVSDGAFMEGIKRARNDFSTNK